MKKVAVIMGSDSDLPVVTPAIKQLKELNIETEVRVMSAHRTPKQAQAFAENAADNGFGVIIAAAGMAALVAFILVSIAQPGRVTGQALEQVHPHILVFGADEPQPEQKGSERKRRVVSHRRLAGHRLFQVDGLGGHSQRQGDVGADFPSVERALEAAPFHRPVVKHRMKVEGVIARPVVMVVRTVTPLVPGAAELLHRKARRHIADHLHHVFPRQVAILFHPSLLGAHGLQD